MNKRSFSWPLLADFLTTGALILSIFSSAAMGHPVSDSLQEEFGSDPALTEPSLVPVTSETSPLTIKSTGDQTNVAIETQTFISPYLGAVKKQTDAPEDLPPRFDNSSDNPLKNYHMETGVGIRVNKQTEMNLGYRFNDTPSLLDNQGSESSSPDNGDLRFSLEFKLPF